MLLLLLFGMNMLKANQVALFSFFTRLHVGNSNDHYHLLFAIARCTMMNELELWELCYLC